MPDYSPYGSKPSYNAKPITNQKKLNVMPSIIITTPTEEIAICKIKSFLEAMLCAAILQANTNNPETHIYYVEHKGKRQQPGKLTQYMPYMSDQTQKELKQYFKD